MLNDGDTQVDVKITEDYLDGFEMTLHNFDFHNHSESSIRERLQTLSDFIHELEFTVNDKELTHRDLTEWDNKVTHATSIENDMCVGWIGAATNWSWDSTLKIYYKGRFVTTMPNMPFTTGRIHLKDNVLNLVAPDRKAIIEDDKLQSFTNMLRSILKKFCNDLVLDTHNDLSDYAHCIKRYFDANSVKNEISFVTFKTKDSHAIDYLSGLSVMCETNKDIKCIEDYEIALQSQNTNAEELADANGVVSVDIDNEFDPKSVIRTQTASGYSSSSSSEPTVDPLGVIGESHKNDTTHIEGETLVNAKEPVFFLRFKDIYELRHKLAIARHYNLRIIIARNDIEYDVLEEMKETITGSPIAHINTLQEDIKIHGEISNLTLNGKEKRASMLFGMLSTMFNYDENVFVIGDVTVTKTVTVKSINATETIKDKNVKILYSEDSDTIFIDRTLINDKKLTPNVSAKLNLQDMQFILANLENISRALAGFENMDSGDKIKDNDVDEIMFDIINLLSRYEPSKEIPTMDDSTKKHKLTRKEKKRQARNERRLINN